MLGPGEGKDEGADHGDLPAGFRELLGIELDDEEPGAARLRLAAESRHLNPAGTVHGGAIATLVDTAMGQAVATELGDQMPVTVEIKINYLEAGREGVLVATARVHKRGKRFTVLEAEVTQQETGDLVAFGTGTFTTIG